MKSNFTLLASILTLVFSSSPSATAQWVQTSTPKSPYTNSYIEIQCFAASDSDLFSGTYFWGVIRSTDSGLTWTDADSGLSKNSMIYAIAVSGTGDSTKVFAGTDSGFYRSTDHGATWTRKSDGLTNDTVTCLAQINNNLFAGTNNGLFRSTDNGENWVAADTGMDAVDLWCMKASGTNLYAGTLTHLFLSTNEGTNWSEIDNGELYGV